MMDFNDNKKSAVYTCFHTIESLCGEAVAVTLCIRKRVSDADKREDDAQFQAVK